MSTVSTAPTTTSGNRSMKLTVSRETFLARLGVAVRGVSTRSSIQTLSGVMLRAEGGALQLQATDMEIGVRVGVAAEVERDKPDIVLPGRLLLDVVRSLPNDDLALEYKSDRQDVEVVSGSARFQLRTLPSEDFPKLPTADGAPTLRVPAPAFVDTVSR